MLVRFRVSNYLSFAMLPNGDPEEFSMIAGKMTTQKAHINMEKRPYLLYTAALYGANASGKSNFVQALKFMKDCVAEGEIPAATQNYFKLKDSSLPKTGKNESSYFEVEVRLEDHLYLYGFEVLLSENRILSEWLVEVDECGNETELLVRDLVNQEYHIVQSSTASKVARDALTASFDGWKDDDSILFLHEINRRKVLMDQDDPLFYSLREVYRWFKRSLVVISPADIAARLRKTWSPERLTDILQACGTGINKSVWCESTENDVFRGLGTELTDMLRKNLLREYAAEKKEHQTPENPVKTEMILVTGSGVHSVVIEDDRISYYSLKFQHGEESVLFGFDEESDGTRRLIQLAEVLTDDVPKTYIIDELDRCLHPQLTAHFVELFQKNKVNRQDQLIFTCHDACLMDENILRRDEIWLAEKSKSGSTHLTSLEEFKIRTDTRIGKAYREGRFGGVPAFSRLFPIGE